jgi:catalase
MVMWTMSDRAIPRSLPLHGGLRRPHLPLRQRRRQGTFVKFHWKPRLGMQSVVWDEAVKINGADPDFHRRDLWNAIEAATSRSGSSACRSSTTPSPTPSTSTCSTHQAHPRGGPRCARSAADAGPHRDNFFAETEQVAFCTQNVVPGIDFSNDPLLQGRNFSYLDTQLKRLGSPNFTQLPVNAPRCPVAHFQRDGHMQMSCRAPGARTTSRTPSPVTSAARGRISMRVPFFAGPREW